MEWKELHELEDFDGVELSGRQEVLLSLAGNIDPNQFAVTYCLWDLDKAEALASRFTTVSLLAEYLETIIPEENLITIENHMVWAEDDEV